MIASSTRLAVLTLAVLATGTTRAAVDVGGTACVVRGKATLYATIYADATSSTQLLTLSSVERTVELSDFPADTSTGRVHLRARRDVPSLRIDGFFSGKEAPLYSTREVPVVSSVVAITAGTALRVLTDKASFMHAEPTHPTFARSRAAIECQDLATVAAPKVGTLPASPKSVVLKNKVTPLYETPTGKAVFQLEPTSSEYPTELVAYEIVSGFQHVRLLADVRIDAWVRVADVRTPKEDDFGAGGLGLGGIGTGGSSKVPKLAVAKVDTDVFLARSSKGVRAAVLEKGAPVKVWGVVDGWAELTTAEAYAPPGKTFQVRESDLTFTP